MKRTRRRPALMVTTGGRGVVAHAGARLLCELADDVGLVAGLSSAMAPTKQRRRGHDRGEVLVDLAVALADGATTISDLRVLRDQPKLFGEVASVPTAWRALEAVDQEALERIADARATARRRAWEAGMDPGFYVIDIDGTLVEAHSEKEEATANYKRGFGFYPLVAYLDATGEALAALLRRGNAGSGTAADHVCVLEASLAQLPVDPRSDAGGAAALQRHRRPSTRPSSTSTAGNAGRDRRAKAPEAPPLGPNRSIAPPTDVTTRHRCQRAHPRTKMERKPAGFTTSVNPTPDFCEDVLVRPSGFEPETCGLRVRCSAVELEAHRRV
jgi:Transposase DDE domain group 1